MTRSIVTVVLGMTGVALQLAFVTPVGVVSHVGDRVRGYTSAAVAPLRLNQIRESTTSPTPTPSPSGTAALLSPDPGSPLEFTVPPTTSPEENRSIAPQSSSGIDGGVLLLSLIGGVVVLALLIGVVRRRAKRG